MFNPIAMIRKRRMKKQQMQEALFFDPTPMPCHIVSLHHPPPQNCQRQREADFSKYTVLSFIAIIVCSLVSISESVSVTSNSNFNIRNINSGHLLRSRHAHIRGVRGVVAGRGGTANAPLNNNNNNNYHFLEQQNEYDSSSSGVSILDDDTLRLSLAIDDDSAGGGGLSAPSLHVLEPKVYLRVSGESGMINQDYQQQKENNNNNEVIIRQSSISKFPSFRASPSQINKHRQEAGTDLHYQSNEEDHEPVEEGEVEDEDDDMSDNYHHHFPYIESYREKYVKPDFGNHVPSVVTTTPPSPTSQPTIIPSKKDAPSLSASKSKQQEWSDIIAQVTTPSSFNEINSSASEHRLADFHIRANLPAYFYNNKYSPYSEEDLENVADLDDEHSKYFVKTRPRSVTTAGNNIYSNFYYEPPSFSTKSVPIPVKTNKDKVVFASFRPTIDPAQQQLYTTSRTNEEDFRNHHHNSGEGGQIYHGNHDEEAQQQNSPAVMTNISTKFASHAPFLTPQQMNYDREAGDTETNHSNNMNDNYSNESILKTSASSAITHNQNQAQHQEESDYFYKNKQNHSSGGGTRANNNSKSSAETLDVSTSQSILSKVTVNNPHHPQLVIIKAEPIKTTLATPGQHEMVTHDDGSYKHTDEDDNNGEVNSSEANNAISDLSSSTTEATSIPGVPGIDYPTLGEIPQTGFDCQQQRYKGFFADTAAKCQAWHYCDFTDGHSTFLCPNGTLFSQVLLTCDWWFNVDCNQATQLYVLNERLYRYIKPPKPSFPEDFIGEHVDKWLIQQFANGYLPKVRKKSKAKFVNLPPPTRSTDSPAQNDTEKDV